MTLSYPECIKSHHCGFLYWSVKLNLHIPTPCVTCDIFLSCVFLSWSFVMNMTLSHPDVRIYTAVNSSVELYNWTWCVHKCDIYHSYDFLCWGFEMNPTISHPGCEFFIAVIFSNETSNSTRRFHRSAVKVTTVVISSVETFTWTWPSHPGCQNFQNFD